MAEEEADRRREERRRERLRDKDVDDSDRTEVIATSTTGAAIGAVSKMAWWRQLSFYQLLVLVGIGLISFAVWSSATFLVSVAVPKHLQQIQDGYLEIKRANIQELKELEESHAEERARSREAFSKDFQRVSERYDERLKERDEAQRDRDKMLEKFTDKLESILREQKGTSSRDKSTSLRVEKDKEA